MTKKSILSIIAFVSVTCLHVTAQSLNPTSSISNAGTADIFKAGYTFAYATSGTPWNGSLISYGGFPVNNYDTQISSDYGPDGGSHISYRTKNGNINTWNQWNELATRGTNIFIGNQVVNGRIGIGTIPDNAMTLDVNGKIFARSLFYVNDVMGGDGGDLRIGPNTGNPSSTIFMIGGINAAEVMRVNYNGNVGIGIKNPQNKLDVNGTIHSKEVKVDLNFPAPDYVFTNDYKLRSLQEVETYVNQNNHLPEIPSAQEFEKNGVQLGEMNMALLKKIEELTLYAIEQQKKMEKLNKIVEEQNKRLEVLEMKRRK